MQVSVARVTLRIVESRSLKGKRKVIRSVLDKSRAKFRVSAAEVGLQDKWQMAELGFACVSSNGHHAEEVIQKVIRFVENMHVAMVTECRTEIVHFGETWENEAWGDPASIDESYFYGPDSGEDPK